jgi:hypothetical protein
MRLKITVVWEWFFEHVRTGQRAIRARRSYIVSPVYVRLLYIETGSRRSCAVTWLYYGVKGAPGFIWY